MSVRAVGEGHLSCIEFRTGMHRRRPTASTLDEPGTAPTDAARRRSHRRHSRVTFARNNCRARRRGLEGAGIVLDALPRAVRRGRARAGARATCRPSWSRRSSCTSHRPSCECASPRATTRSSSPRTRLDERVLLPASPAESHGMEDARLVRFVDDDGTLDYRATYTAFDGARIAPAAAAHRRTSARFAVVAAERPGGEEQGHGAVPPSRRRPATSRCPAGTGRTTPSPLRRTCDHWEDAGTPADARAARGSSSSSATAGRRSRPTAGWLVLTHGVGPMREYAIGAMLLDLDDPRGCIGRAARAAAHAARGRARRLRPQRRLLLRRAAARRHAGAAVRGVGCDGAGRTGRSRGPAEQAAPRQPVATGGVRRAWLVIFATLESGSRWPPRLRPSDSPGRGPSVPGPYVGRL